MKQKTCKVCRQKYLTTKPLQQVCGLDCAVIHSNNTKAKQQAKEATRNRVELRKAKEKAKPLKKWLDEAQVLVNRYVVKIRDKDEPCISCGTRNPNIQYAAGHFRSRGAASHLRYNLDNLHKQCNKHCNCELAGNIRQYRPALIAKIGQERFDAIENNNESKKWTIDEAQKIISIYKKLLKELT